MTFSCESLIKNGTVLLIQDEERVRTLTEAFLEKHGYTVFVAADGKQAIRNRPFKRYDLILLDLDLRCSDYDGHRVLRSLREDEHTPIMVLSKEEDVFERVRAIEWGADDYLVKPFSPVELAARIGALLRRSRLPSTLRADRPFELKPESQTIVVWGESIKLPRKQYQIVSVLASEPGRLFSREELFEAVWGDLDTDAVRRVDLYLSRARVKIQRHSNQDFIVSEYGRGYRFQP